MDGMEKLTIVLVCIILFFVILAIAIIVVHFKKKKRQPDASNVKSKDQLLELNEAIPRNVEIIGCPYKIRKAMLPLSLIARYFPNSNSIVNISTLKERGVIARQVNKIGVYGYADNVPTYFLETNYIDKYALRCIEQSHGTVILRKMQ